MGTPPAGRRTPGRSLGAIGRTTLADSAVGGGHDALIRRLLTQGGQEWTGSTSGKVLAWMAEVPVTGAGVFTISEHIVDDKWDTGQPCRVTASALFGGAYWPVRANTDPDPALWVRPPMMEISLIDGDPDAVHDPTDPAVEYASTLWPVSDQYPNASNMHPIETVSWDYVRGRPRLIASCVVDEAAAPGLSGATKLVVRARITRL